MDNADTKAAKFVAAVDTCSIGCGPEEEKVVEESKDKIVEDNKMEQLSSDNESEMAETLI